jgi:hypothetical protein
VRDGTLEVSIPTAEKFGASVGQLAPRLTSLSGRTIGLVWNAKPNGDVALKRAGALIQQQVPDVKVNFYSGSLPCRPDLLRQALEECDAFIACTAD